MYPAVHFTSSCSCLNAHYIVPISVGLFWTWAVETSTITICAFSNLYLCNVDFGLSLSRFQLVHTSLILSINFEFAQSFCTCIIGTIFYACFAEKKCSQLGSLQAHSFPSWTEPAYSSYIPKARLHEFYHRLIAFCLVQL